MAFAVIGDMVGMFRIQQLYILLVLMVMICLIGFFFDWIEITLIPALVLWFPSCALRWR